jgi:peptidoglycan-N-acetylglucosamine deacetylase
MRERPRNGAKSPQEHHGKRSGHPADAQSARPTSSKRISPRTPKIAYLTIDDGPSKDMRLKVDLLLERQVPAIWFCCGDMLAQRLSDATYAIKHGFIVGNHSFNHLYFSDLTLEECYEQIKRTDDFIEHAYRDAGTPRTARYFRFPYGDKGGLTHSEVFDGYSGEGVTRKHAIQEYLLSLGYTQPPMAITYRYYQDAKLLEDADWHWTYDVMEYVMSEPEPTFGIDSIEKVFARMDEDEPEGCRGLNDSRSEEIILLHDHEETTEHFGPIVDRLLAKGIVFRLP